MGHDPERLELEQLEKRCREESSKFFRDEQADDRFCYELFRRALKFRNKYAWEIVWNSYRNLVRGWIRAMGGYDQTDTPIEELVTLSFERFWFAFYHKSIEHFPTLPALLQYLRLCCASTVTDRLRRHKYEQLLTDIDDAFFLASNQRPEQRVVDDEERTRFWQLVETLLHDEQEALLIRSYFLLGFKPRQIHKQYPEAFPTVQDVYRVKRNVMNRLRRADELQQYWHA